MIKICSGILILLLLFSSGLMGALLPAKTENPSPDLQPVRAWFKLPNEQIDLAHARLTVEKLVYSGTNIPATLQRLDEMAREVQKVPSYREDTEGKLNGLLQYLYHPGTWNQHKPYQYDFDDPTGTEKKENALLSHYIQHRKGNCVSMPLLFMALAQRLDMDVYLSTAPQHFFVKLKEDGVYYNIETTAGGLKHENSYIRDFEITPEAVRNRIYLQPLTKKETLSVLMGELGSHYLHEQEFEKAFEITEIMLTYYPNNVGAMLLRGNIWNKVLERDTKAANQQSIQPTIALHRHFQELLKRNHMWFERAESLGWQAPGEDYDRRYLQIVRQARGVYDYSHKP